MCGRLWKRTGRSSRTHEEFELAPPCGNNLAMTGPIARAGLFAGRVFVSCVLLLESENPVISANHKAAHLLTRACGQARGVVVRTRSAPPDGRPGCGVYRKPGMLRASHSGLKRSTAVSRG
jgi:hypothetical protein